MCACYRRVCLLCDSHSSALWVVQLVDKSKPGGSLLTCADYFRLYVTERWPAQSHGPSRLQLTVVATRRYHPATSRYLSIAPSLRQMSSINHLATRLVTVKLECDASYFQAVPQTNATSLAGRLVYPGEGFKLAVDGKWWVGVASTVPRTANMPVDATPALSRADAVVEAASRRIWAWRNRERALCYTALCPPTSQAVAVERATRTLTELACFANETHAASKGLR